MKSINRITSWCSAATFLLLGVVATPKPSAAQRQVICRDITVQLPQTRVLNLPHTGGGDSEMHGNDPNIEIDTQLQHNGAYLILSGRVKITEGKQNWSEFQSNFSRQIYVPALDSSSCALRGVSFYWGSLRANAGRDNHQWTTYSGNGHILQSKCLADSKGNDSGRLGCVIDFQPLILRMERR